MNDLELIIIVLFCIIIHTFLLYVYFDFLSKRKNNSIIYKKEMQNAQNTAKQYKQQLRSKKKAYKSLQRSYSCLEQENKCLKAKLCERGASE